MGDERSSETLPSLEEFSEAFDDVASEVAELVNVASRNGGCLLLLSVLEAASSVRGGRIDEALAALDEADGHIQVVRDKVEALGRGEAPARASHPARVASGSPLQSCKPPASAPPPERS